MAVIGFDDDFTVTLADMRAAGYCSRQPRGWFSKHGLSWTVFITEGYPASVLLDLNDSLAVPVVEAARRRLNDGK